MSHVRMCDKCGTVFSELEDGWQSFSVTTTIEDDDGRPRQIQQAMDACPACSIKPKKQFERERAALEAGKDREARIARLEREMGMQEDGTFKPDTTTAV